MKIHLQEDELKEAIKQYISNEGIDLSQREISIELTAGRGTKGHYADIELVEQRADGSADPFSEASTEKDADDQPDPSSEAINFD